MSFAALSIAIALLAGGAPVDFSLDVTDFGATPDASSDSTKAFQSALDKAAANGAVVRVPPGQYRFDGVLSIPEGVTLEGTWRGPHTSQLDKGSTLLACAGRDKEDSAPFISLRTAGTVKGLTIFYPEQKPTDVRPYPWTIQGRGQHFNVIDVVICNAYNGIDCGTYHNEGHHLRNVHMCALRRGVFIDQTTDIGRLENVHIHNVYWWRVSAPYTPTAEENAAMERYTLANLEGFIIGRTDWEYISNCFVIWPKVGFLFIETSREGRAGGKPNVLITQSGSDIGPLAVKVESTQGHAGIAFENCQFMAGVEIAPQNVGPVKFANCGFWGGPGSGSHVVNAGSGTVFLSACHFNRWAADRPCVEFTDGTLLMTGCDFVQIDGDPVHVRLRQSVKAASMVGNSSQGVDLTVVNESAGDVKLVGNVRR